MNQYIGLDGHKESCTFVVLDEKGRLTRKAVIEPHTQALIKFIKTIPGKRHLCVEEGTQSQWFYEIFSAHVHDLAVVEGRKNRGPKDDAKDARGLAERFWKGDLGPRIYKVPESLTTLKDLVKSYETINKDLTRVRNRLKHQYRSRGFVYSETECPYCKKSALTHSDCRKPGFHQNLVLLHKQQQELEPLKAEAQKAMVAEAARHSITRILKTAPGFGPVRSAEMLSIVIDPYRFRTSRQLWKYCGLAIVTRSSGDWIQKPNGQWIRAQVAQTRGLNQDFNRPAKAIFKGAAMTAITANRKETHLRADYDRLLKNGTKPNLARLTIARKIAAIVLAMWKNKEGYNPEKYSMINKK